MKISLLIILLSFLLFSGCNKADPNPELKDFIYLDLNSKKSALDLLVIEQEKQLADIETEIHEENRDYYRKRHEGKKLEVQKGLQRLKQELRYLETRIKSRKVYVKKAYVEARQQGKELDFTAEVDSYKKLEDWRVSIRGKKTDAKLPEVPEAGTEAPKE